MVYYDSHGNYVTDPLYPAAVGATSHQQQKEQQRSSPQFGFYGNVSPPPVLAAAAAAAPPPIYAPVSAPAPAPGHVPAPARAPARGARAVDNMPAWMKLAPAPPLPSPPVAHVPTTTSASYGHAPNGASSGASSGPPNGAPSGASNGASAIDWEHRSTLFCWQPARRHDQLLRIPKCFMLKKGKTCKKCGRTSDGLEYLEERCVLACLRACVLACLRA